MKLYLSSYKIGDKKEILKEWLLQHGSDILVIPNALDIFADGDRKTLGITDKSKELEELGFTPKILDLRKYFNNPKLLKEDIKKYHAFYVLGGNVFTLRMAMKLSGFDKYLQEIAQKPDYLYAGFSAGICVLAKDLHGIDLADEPINPYNTDDVIYEGIGLIDYLIVPHYDTPSHPESKLMYKVVEYLKQNNLNYKTLQDGDVIIDETVDIELNHNIRL